MPRKLRDEVIGKRIRQARDKMYFTQDEVANEIGISRDKLANIESGRTVCSFADAVLICKFLGLDINTLAQEDESQLEGVILFRNGNQESDEDQLLDFSDTIFKELTAQEELYRKKRGREQTHV